MFAALRFARKAGPAAFRGRACSSSASTEQQSALRRFCSAYEEQLERRPVLTKSVTSGVLYGIGDVIAQNISSDPSEGFDSSRLLRALAYGGVFYPFPAHVHYNFLEWLVVQRMAVSTAAVPFVKAFIEQFVYWSYLSNAYYHGVLGALQGFSPTEIYDRIADTLWDTLKAQWAFWIPAQLINFKFVPVRHQLNFVLVVSLAWTTFLSLAFPPEKANHKS
eukprot:TRINITY_DN37308_c0_g2_i1.p1 TRINITY_DN37308_c0_g2~~TRINITY_DN37308_c0_g2_i1.p1  ORF type:complete len:220 (+),score=29.13 TRINITY_DN37308_c0_g2_i1:83-742(+)